MDTVHFNWVAILVAGVAFFALGAIWYAPPVFGNAWKAAVGAMPSPIGIAESGVVNVVAALLLAVVLGWAGVHDWQGGVQVATVAWAACAGTAAVANTLFERGRAFVILINAGYQLVGFVIMGAIIGAWQ